MTYMCMFGERVKARQGFKEGNRMGVWRYFGGLAVVLFACYPFEAFCYYRDGYPMDSGSILNS